jgi:hypothetical protein
LERKFPQISCPKFPKNDGEEVYPVIGQTKNALDVEVERDVNRWTVVGKSRHVHVNEGINTSSPSFSGFWIQGL